MEIQLNEIEKVFNEFVSDLKSSVKFIEDIRTNFLFGDIADLAESLPPISEQNYLLALSALEQAKRFMQLSDYYNMKGE